ncbi:MAG: adenylate/guanylate cyclase domain-containing protein [Candidatus Firestonebacteria bacterium]
MKNYFRNLLKFNLRNQLSVIFSVLIALSIGSISLLTLQNQVRILKTNFIATGQQFCESIAGNVSDALSQAPIDDTALVSTITKVVNSSDNKKWIKYVRITDADESIIIASNNIAGEWNKKYISPVFEVREKTPYYFKVNGGVKEKIYEVKSEVKKGEETIGKVHLGVSQNAIDVLMASAAKTVIIAAVLTIVFGFFVSSLVAMFLVRPIKLLIDGASKISAGNYDLEIKVKMMNEIDDLVNSFNDMAKNLKEKEQIKVAFSRYMSAELLNEVIKSGGRTTFGGEKRLVTILFSDIRDFTSMAEALDPQQVVRLLNEYFTCMNEVIFRNKGMINKYMGDAIMALYGAPVPLKDHAVKAVATALEMNKELNNLRTKWSSEGRPIFGMKIGITTGEVVLGNIGSMGHMEYTVIGDAVNVAARLQALNKNYGTQILVSQKTNDLVKDHFETRQVELVQFKGKTSFDLVYEVLGVKQGVR